MEKYYNNGSHYTYSPRSYIDKESEFDEYEHNNKSSILKMSRSVDKALLIIVTQTIVIAALIASTIYFAFKDKSSNKDESVPLSNLQSYLINDDIYNKTYNIIGIFSSDNNISTNMSHITRNITRNITNSRYLERKLFI
jgi:hypothetical protein